MPRVTGVGGIFFKAKDPKKLRDWYRTHLDIGDGDQDYAMFHWLEKTDPPQDALTVFSIFPDDTDYFNPSDRPFMFNFRVEDLEAVASALEAEGIAVQRHDQDDYGKFAWIMDPEGNRIELWEPPKEG